MLIGEDENVNVAKRSKDDVYRDKINAKFRLIFVNTPKYILLILVYNLYCKKTVFFYLVIVLFVTYKT